MEPGERLVLVGASGSGKTTLLRLIAGLEDPDAGDVEIDGVRVNDVPPHRRGVGLVSQRPTLYPHMTVRKNLSVEVKASAERIAESIELLRLSHLLERYPHQLSGGELQRVALARLLIRQPSVWLLDEPLAALDPAFRSEFRADLHLLLSHVRPTMILVTHDPTDAPALGHRVGVLGDGRLKQIGTPEELRDRPKHRLVALALGRFHIMYGCVVGGDISVWRLATEKEPVEVPLPNWLRLPPGSRLTLGIRPEDFLRRTPDSAPPNQPGAVLDGWSVVLAEPDGSGWLLTLTRQQCRLRVAWSSGPPPAIGALTNWFLPADRCVWFSVEGDRIQHSGFREDESSPP